MINKLNVDQIEKNDTCLQDPMVVRYNGFNIKKKIYSNPRYNFQDCIWGYSYWIEQIFVERGLTDMAHRRPSVWFIHESSKHLML